ncbi:AzlC family ABC transporter permease [Aquibaculum arenosum]|uniref:AzlC family ABC transporter permease n=1 Tax=Aquibaculum arenosum TaxID=3032591 RepID=A0ABT5YM69_9PROT|nr:AzlC family ABC transporter permease [Fodinicurvata sp. CAU 1616]MDF2096060.1 AzlC family ABC transporter permease [Fodinicurvata sp. CAU 1616]
MTVVFTFNGLRQGYLRTLPIAVGVSVFGLVYGLVAGQKGLSLAETMLMSALVFAGAAQMLALEIWQEPVPVLALTVAVGVINLRYMMMTAVLRPWLAPVGPLKAYGSLFFTADENWAVGVAEMRRGNRDAAFYLGTGLALWSFWLLSGALGRIFGGLVSAPEVWGLDFVAVAVFLALLIPMWEGPGRNLLPWLAAGLTAWLLYDLLPGTWYLVAGGLAGSLLGALLGKHGEPSIEVRS